MRRSMATSLWRFSTTRMLQEYTEQLYLPAAGVRRPARDPSRRSSRKPADRRWRPRISLALALHNHQPVGNFGWVFAEVYEQAYQPMVEALERHPGVRLSLHYTGPAARVAARRAPGVHRPPARARRPRPGRDPGRRLLRAGPRLAARARPDRPAARGWATSSRRSSDGGRSGAWLAERVWEPDLPTSLAAAGYDWTILDDAHFRAAAIPEEDLWGPYTTEDQGHLLRVFGTEQGLRYRIPFRDVEEVIDYLRDARHRGRRPGRDDGRRRREVRRLADDLGALLGRGPLGRALLRGARGERRLADDDDAVRLARRPPADRPGLRPDRLVRRDGRVGAAARREPGLHRGPPSTPRTSTGPRRAGCAAPSGATSRSSTARSTTSTSRCCGCRRRSPRCPPGPTRDRALDHLYQGQSNDCYWHGLFGGHLHQPHAAGDVRAPHRRRGPRRDARPAALVRRRATRPRPGRRRRGPAGGRGPGRDGRPRRRARASAAGTSGRSATR